MKDNRIQELAEQAEEWNADGDKCEVNLQKFAELIIAECAKLCEPVAQPEQEPVGVIQHLDELNEQWTKHLPIGTKLYASPPQSFRESVSQQMGIPMTPRTFDDYGNKIV